MRKILSGLLGFVLGFMVLAADGGSIAAPSRPFVVIGLGTLGGTYSEPFDSGSALNASGQVVGSSTTATSNDYGEAHAFLWTRQDGMLDLGTLGGDTSFALAVNASGQVVGKSTTTSGEFHAFLWTQQDGMLDLGTLAGGVSSYALAVNASGQVAGTSFTNDGGGEYQAVLWQR